MIPDREIDLANGPGYKFIKMTDNFDFSWDVDEKERHWRHIGQPWQYQLNPTAIHQSYVSTKAKVQRNVQRDRTFPFQGNMSWGGFPGGRTDGFGYECAFNSKGSANPKYVQWHRDTPYQGDETGRANIDEGISGISFEIDGGVQSGTEVVWQSHSGSQGTIAPVSLNLAYKPGGGGKGTNALQFETQVVKGVVPKDFTYRADEEGEGGPQAGWEVHNAEDTESTWYQNGGLGMGYNNIKNAPDYPGLAYNAWKDQTARNQITGVPQMNTPPPLILMRTNDRGNAANINWQFWCKYSVVFEGHRNTMGYFPLPQGGTATSSWTGCGNLGFTTAPGMGDYNNIYLDEPWVEAPLDYPVDAPDQAASNWLSDGTRPVWPSGNTKEDSIYVGSSDEEE
jgi:hypothetical protein